LVRKCARNFLGKMAMMGTTSSIRQISQLWTKWVLRIIQSWYENLKHIYYYFVITGDK
jgi:hypothetical protein